MVFEKLRKTHLRISIGFRKMYLFLKFVICSHFLQVTYLIIGVQRIRRFYGVDYVSRARTPFFAKFKFLCFSSEFICLFLLTHDIYWII